MTTSWRRSRSWRGAGAKRRLHGFAMHCARRAGADHPLKGASRALLERAIADGEVLVTDAEVLQEILRRYVAIDRRDAIGPATDAIRGVVDEVYPVEREDVERARRLVQATRLSARDAVHVAIMRRRGITRILSFDRGFDEVEGIARNP